MSRRRRKNRRHEAPREPSLPVPVEPEPPVLRSNLLQDPRSYGSDVRTIKQMLRLGVVEESVVEALLKRAYVRAADNNVSARDFRNLMSLIKDFAKLQIDIEKLDRPVRHQHAHLHAHGTVDPEGSRLSEIAERAGIPALYQ